MAGITEQGFESKRLINVVGDMRADAQPIFQDLVPPGDVVDVSNSSTIGRLTALVSLPIADLWEAAQQVYSAFDVNSVKGIPQDNLYAIGGVTRIPESPTVADVYIVGDNGTTISANTQFRSSTTSRFFDLRDDVVLSPDNCHGVGITITTISPNTEYILYYRSVENSQYLPVSITSDSGPTATSIYDLFEQEIASNHPSLTTYQRNGVLFVRSTTELRIMSFFSTGNLGFNKIIGIGVAVCEETGPNIQAPNTINTIATPQLGLDSVSNPLSATIGTNRESDEDYRIRFRDTKFQRATNIIEALYSALYTLDSVNNVAIYDNDTDIIDTNGVLPHSFWTIVDGGLETDIARAIWLNRPTGIRSQGGLSIDILDSQGYTRTVKFSRPSNVDIHVEMTLTTNTNFPVDGIDQIKKNLINHIQALRIGEDVVFSRLYTPINSVAGHQVDSLAISVDGVTFSASNIAIGLDQKAVLTANNITIS